jgi:hypothetical protein
MAMFGVVTPCSLVGNYQSFGGTCCLNLQKTTEVKHSLKMSVVTYKTTKSHNPENHNQYTYASLNNKTTNLSFNY